MSETLTQVVVHRIEAGQALAGLATLMKAQDGAAQSATRAVRSSNDYETVLRKTAPSASAFGRSLQMVGGAALQGSGAVGGLAGSMLSLVSSLNPAVIAMGAISIGFAATLGYLIRLRKEADEDLRIWQEIQLLAPSREAEEEVLRRNKEALAQRERERKAAVEARQFEERQSALRKSEREERLAATRKAMEELTDIAITNIRDEMKADEDATAERKRRGHEIARSKMGATRAEMEFYLDAERQKRDADKETADKAKALAAERNALALQTVELGISGAFRLARAIDISSAEKTKAAIESIGIESAWQAAFMGATAIARFALGDAPGGTTAAASALAYAGIAAAAGVGSVALGAAGVGPVASSGGGGGGSFAGGGASRSSGAGGAGGTVTNTYITISGVYATKVEVGRAVQEALDAAGGRR